MKGLLIAALLAASPVWAIDVPSGQPVEMQEVLVDQLGTENWLRFRFIAPEISRDGNDAATAADMTHLCEVLALPYIAEYALTGDVIVISLADRATEFGVADRDAIQFFEAYRVQDGRCIWEGL